MHVLVTVNLGPDDPQLASTPAELATKALEAVGGDPAKDTASVTVNATISPPPPPAG